MQTGRILVLFFLMFLVIPVFLPGQVLAKNEKHVSGQILVKFKDSTSPAYIAQELKKHQGSVKDKVNRIETVVVQVPAGREEATIEKLKKNPNVLFAEPDFIADAADFPADLPNDLSFLNNQWGLNNSGQTILGQIGKINADVNADIAWHTTIGSGVKVAVLDSGVDSAHPDLAGKILLTKDFSGSGSADDLYGHGTHVSGIIGAVTNNGVGVAGSCPGCSLLIGKVLNNYGSGAYSWISNGIIWSVDNGAKVINLSLAGTSSSLTLENAVNYALSKNVVVVAAAGNSSNSVKNYPAGYTNVISVASTNNLDQKSSFSNYGSWVSLAAPGENIYSTFPTHTFYMRSVYGKSLNYDYLSGTSMATPLTSGVAALIWGSSFGTSGADVKQRIESTADKIQGTGSFWINGRVNAAAAVATASATPAPSATPSPTPVVTPSPTPSPTASPTPTLTPSPTPSPSPTLQPTPTPAATPSPSPSATPVPINIVKIGGINYSTLTYFANFKTLTVTINVINGVGNPVLGSSVSVNIKNTTTNQSWSGSGSSNGSGNVVFNMGFVPSGVYTTTVTAVTANGLVWDTLTPANSFAK